MYRAFKRALLWIYLYVQVIRIHAMLQRKGFNVASKKFLSPPREGQNQSFSEQELKEIGDIVVSVCAFQLFDAQCLHRAIASYHLLSRFGGRPVFCMSVASRPFIGHAWCEVQERRVGDPGNGYMDQVNSAVVLRIPS